MSDGLNDTLQPDTDPLHQLMIRCEAGLPHHNDAAILFEALKDAAAANSKPEQMLIFLRHHIQQGKIALSQRMVEH